jgi:cysteine sulfinate desulfinase/cysteine desulfurase-like protein
MKGENALGDFLRARRGRVRPDARLAVVMLVNHETGAIQSVRRAAELAGEVAVHCDATQAVGKVAVDFRALGVATFAIGPLGRDRLAGAS